MKDSLLTAKVPCGETGIAVHKSVCAICDPLTQCGLDILVKDGEIIRVEGSRTHPFNKGRLCVKGAAMRQYVYHKDRIQTPMRRVGARGTDDFAPIGWDEALDLIAQRCLDAKKCFGPESAVFYCGYTKFFRPWLKRMAHAFGSPNYCTESSACSTATRMAQQLVFGSVTAPDIEKTDCLLVWSSNPFYSKGSGGALLRARARGATLIVVDPRQTPTTDLAHLHLALRPGTDGALALAMAHTLIQENLCDEAFIRGYTHGFEEFRQFVLPYSPAWAQEHTGVPAEQIRLAARLLGKAKSACILSSAAPVVHNTNGVQNYRAVFQLLALTGNFDVPGGNVVRQGAFLNVVAGLRSRGEEFERPNPARTYAPRIGAGQFPVWMELVPGEAQAMALPEQLRTGVPYPLKTLLAFGMNHRMWPDPEGFRKSLEGLDFFVNVDPFWTDTCRLADLVLPACTSVERSELRCYPSGHVILTQPAIAPLYESRSDFDILRDLARRLCPEDALLAQGLEANLDWILAPSGLTVETLRRHPEGMEIPDPIPYTPRKYKQGLHTPSGKAEFLSGVLARQEGRDGHESLPVYHPPRLSREAAPALAERYPMVLCTGARIASYQHSRTYRLSWLDALRPNRPAADLNPADAAARGIGQGGRMRLSTPFGAVTVTANLTQAVQPGVVHLYHDDPLADANSLLPGDYLDPISGFPGYKASLCRIDRLEEGGDEDA